MDNQTVSMLLRGCNLARELESNLPNLRNRPDLVSNSCQEIARLFNAVQEQIISNVSDDHKHYQMQLNAANLAQATTPLRLYNPSADDDGEARTLAPGSSGHAGTSAEAGGSAAGGQFRAGEGSDPAGGRASSSSSAQRPRRRLDDPTRKMVIVDAPRFGNTEIPPEDGFTWKKYGQKEILGSLYPRSYYRCTHQKLYSCPAKKQVQRLDSNPNTFQVTYRGNHTCLMSSTVPSVSVAPPPPETTLGMVISQPPSSQPSMMQLSGMSTHWVMMDFTLGSAFPSSSSAPGHAVATREREDQHQLVADMADVMFNSGSSSSNSMDMIFSSMEHIDIDQQHCNWQAGDKTD